MGGKRMQKRYAKGEAAQYISRNQCLRKLQISLKTFRKLCILKGIYPVEPKHKKRVGRGATFNKTYYRIKDIRFLEHEPIIETFRSQKVLYRKINTAYNKHNHEDLQRWRKAMPNYRLDHIIKERYPTFVDALRDLDDCLTMIFMFRSLGQLKQADVNKIALCSRLSIEFLHFIIESQSLRKVFFSFKGIYYQADIFGETVTWVIPHKFMLKENSSNIDMEAMASFLELYITLLGFVNFRLYSRQNLFYPPALKEAISKEHEGEECLFSESDGIRQDLAAALSLSLASKKSEIVCEEPVPLDDFPLDEDQDDNTLNKAKQEQKEIEKLLVLFKGSKFFIGRECPLEPLAFIIRCFGGEVSWERYVMIGNTFDEDDEEITYQITDRNLQSDKKFLSRFYIQPQWVLDSVNERRRLPVGDYFPGVVLPPHPSPFVGYHKYEPGSENEDIDEAEIPFEVEPLDGMSKFIKMRKAKQNNLESDNSSAEEESLDGDNVNVEFSKVSSSSPDESSTEDELVSPLRKRKKLVSKNKKPNSEDRKPVSEDRKQKFSNKKRKPAKKVIDGRTRSTQGMKVSSGVTIDVNKAEEDDAKLREEKKLLEMMVHKKKKNLYKKMIFGIKREKREDKALLDKQKKAHQAINKFKRQRIR